MNVSGRIRNEDVREQQCKEEYVRLLESKMGDWDEAIDVKEM